MGEGAGGLAGGEAALEEEVDYFVDVLAGDEALL